ncbi:hypothetical protein PQI51_09680 [Microbacterium esteraromaticum]|uniref:hypothetical protein n=1 Tax=Microbacterium esteraromaticum TaxID=57043 RepID=UPI00309BACBC
MSTPSTPRKPWYKKLWIWAIVAAVIVIGGISNLVNGDRDEPDAAPSTPPAAAATATREPASATPSDEPTPSPEPTPAGPSDEERAAKVQTALQDAFGGQTPSEVYASDSSLWYGYVNGVRVENGNAFITLQVAADDPNRKDLGEGAAQALSTLLPAAAVDGLGWLIVEDASGVVIDQKQPRPIT